MPQDYCALLTPRETQQAIFAIKHYIEEHLCQVLNLMMVTVPLLVEVASGVNDMLDRDGARTPIQFHVWNPVIRRRHELMAGGIRVNAATLTQQLAMANQLDWLTLPYHQGVLNNELPLSIGGALGSPARRCCCSRRRTWARSV